MKLREGQIRRSISDLDAEILTRHLDEVHLSDELVDQLYIRLRQENALVIKRDYTPERYAKRTRFLGDLCAYLLNRGVNATLLDRFTSLESVFEFCDIGYARIATALQNALLKRSTATRISALLDAAADEFRHIEKSGRADAVANRFADHRVALAREKGEPQAFADHALQAVVESLTSALKREGYTESLWDGDDHLVIPRPLETGQRLWDLARGLLAGALIWDNWEIIEERLRYHGGRIEEIPPDERPEENKDDMALRYIPTARESAIMLLLYAAHERLASRTFQNAMTLARITRGENVWARIGDRPALSPEAAISEGEVLADVVIEDVLAVDLRSDTRRYGGLRIAEWLRGYATLGVLARERSSNRNAIMTVAALTEALTGAGLDPFCVGPFLRVATFGRRSADLWDAPLLKSKPLPGEVPNYFLVWPAAYSANLALIVVSTISTIGESQGDKGPAFEVAVFNVIREAGFNPKRLHYRRNGEDYEADVVFPFDDVIVMIECKNRGVPNVDPIDQYRFLEDMADHRHKIDRLRRSLERPPEVLDAEFGEGSSKKRIVPMVTYSLPFAAPAGRSGISYIDYLALRRFFLDPNISALQFDTRVAENITMEVPLRSLWSDERPTAADLERYLASPPQLAVALRHLQRVERVFFGDEDLFVLGPSIQRVAATRASMLEALADNPESAMREIDQATEFLKGLREEK